MNGKNSENRVYQNFLLDSTHWDHIEVVCSNLPEHQRRVKRRLKQKNETDLPNWEAVQSRVYEPWTTERIQIDTNGQNVDQSVQQVLLNFPD